MVKTKLLTPVLAGVLGVSVAGSAVGYVLVNKDSDKDKDIAKTKSKTTVVSPTDKISDGGGLVPGFSGTNAEEAIENAEAAIKGELDFAYDAKMKLTFGSQFSELAGTDVGSIGFTTSTKQKGDQAAADFSVSYNDNEVVSLNTVYDRPSNNVYVQIPQLSDDYLMMNVDDFMKEVEDQFDAYSSTFTIKDVDSLLQSGEETLSFDEEALAEDIQGYIDAVVDAVPDPKDGKEQSGDVEGYDYSYTTKTYTITGDDMYNMAKAVVDRAKTDTILSDIYDQAGGADQLGASYSELIDELSGEIGEFSGSTETVSFDIYYNQDIPAGISFEQDGVKFELKTVLTEAVTAVDMEFSADGEGMYLKGSAETEGDTTNGSFSFTSNIDEEDIEVKYTLTNVTDNSGSVRVDASYDDGYDPISGWTEVILSSSDEALDLTVSVGLNGEDLVTLTFEGNKTDASDITVPSGNIYNIYDESALENYLGNCDTETFLANFKSIIGDELYDALFSSGYDYDDDWDYDDDDWDYDWDDDYGDGVEIALDDA